MAGTPKRTGFLKWLNDKNWREKVAFVCVGLAAVVAAAWTAFVYFQPSPLSLDSKFTVCRADKQSWCPYGAIFVGCGDDPEAAAAEKCRAFEKYLRKFSEGGSCGIAVYDISCSASD